MANLKSFKLAERKEYGKFYGDFRGVDFSTDHTQIDERRFAYLVNMWKNYFTDQGEGIETVPGFRKVYDGAIAGTGIDNTVYAIHSYKKVDPNGESTTYALIHIGTRLLAWDLSKEINVKKRIMVRLPEKTGNAYEIVIPDEVKQGAFYPISIEIWGREEIPVGTYVEVTASKNLLYYTDRTDVFTGQYVTVNYVENFSPPARLPIFSEMNPRKSASFTMNNRLYIIDGKNYLYFDGEKVEEVIVAPSDPLVKRYSDWNGALGDMASIRDLASAKAAFPVGTTIVANAAETEKATVIGYGSSFVEYPGGFGSDFDPFSDTNVVSSGWIVIREGVEAFYGTAYVPTTWRFAVPGGVNANEGKEWESRNLLSDYFRMTFVGDGESRDYFLNEEDLDAIMEVRVNGEISTNYVVDRAKGKVTFDTAPAKPSPEGSDNVEIVAKKQWKGFPGGIGGDSATAADMIYGCTLATVFDSRVFFSGNAKYPNHIFYCGFNDTGYIDPTYFPALNYQKDGVGNSPVTGMIPVADSLLVLKRDAENGGSVFYHTPQETGVNLITKVYPMTQGLNGTGCLGACTSFLDDPVFVSRFGLEAIGQLSVRYERAVEHRSSLVDAFLTKCDLSTACLEEWGGYLFLLVDGKVFMADSRQRFTHSTGVMQYEWYYLEDIGVWERQYEEAVYASEMPEELKGKTVQYDGQEIPICIAESVWDPASYEYVDMRGKVANPPKTEGDHIGEGARPDMDVIVSTDGEVTVASYVSFRALTDKDGNMKAYLCNVPGNFTGGIFNKATCMKAMGDTLYFGTENGCICAFNFDLKNERGELRSDAYSFDERTIYCGCATKMDNCGIPHLTKNTVRKSLVVKTKAMGRYAAKLKVRTNKKPYEQIARIVSGIFSFDDIDFSDFTFDTDGDSLFAIKEKEKRWVEKQYYFYSDEFLKPFSLYYVAFRYSIMGRYKG